MSRTLRTLAALATVWVGLRRAYWVAQVCHADARDYRRVAKDGWCAGEVVKESHAGARSVPRQRRDLSRRRRPWRARTGRGPRRAARGATPAPLNAPLVKRRKLRFADRDGVRRDPRIESPLHPWIVRRVGVHGRATVIDRFGAQFVVPRFVAVDLA